MEVVVSYRVVLAAARRALPGVFIALCVLMLSSCARPPEEAKGVQLVLNPESVAPTTTFELRFDEVVVGADQVGKPAGPSPLLLAPAVRGRFVWLSRRSGVFTPEEPLALGTEYRVALRHDVTNATGRPLAARLHRILRTPDFEVFEAPGRGFSSDSVPARPELRLWFNADVRAAAARPYFEFRAAAGQRVGARVTQATNAEGFFPHWRSLRQHGLTWREEFAAATASNAPAAFWNRLLVEPERDLPFGKAWKLVVRKDLPAAERLLRLPARHEFELGAVVPFGVRSAHAHNGINDGKRIALWFNKRLAPELTASNLHEWITLKPAPTNLTFAPSWGTVELRGNFGLETTYTVAVRAGFPSWDGLTLAQSYTTNLHFRPVPPRLYFPAVETSQILGGRRAFELLAINTGPIRVRAKQLDAATLIHALRGFKSYQKQSDGTWDYWEPFREVDYRAVPGRTIYETNFHPAKATDDPVRLSLRWDDILGPRQPGAVFLAAERSAPEPGKRATLGTQAFIQLTDLGLVWKLSDAAAVVYLFSHTSGQPVSNATLRLLTDENETLAEKTTDSQGLARVPLSTNAVWLLAQAGADLHAVRVSENHAYLWSYGVRSDWHRESEDPRDVMLFTDRTVYRPGETVHLKGLVRDWADPAFTIPAGLQGALQLIDPRDERFLDTNITLSPAGSFALSFALPEGVRGYYRGTLTFDGREHHVGFTVQDFVPNAFNVLLDVEDSFPASEPVRVPVAAHYYMGAPLTRAKVHWSLEASDEGFAPEGFDDFQFCTPYLDERLGRSRSSLTANGDAPYATNLVIAPDVPLNVAAPQPRSVHFRVEITDLNQQTIARAVDFTRQSSDFYLGIGKFPEVNRAGEPLPVELVAIDPAGQPLAQPMSVTLTLQRLEYQTVAVQGAGRTKSYRSELLVSNVLTQQVQTRLMAKSGIKWAIAPGQPPATITLREPGSYLVEARAKDGGGREVVTVATFYLHGAAELAWDYRNDAQLELIPDQGRYRAGDTATLLVKSPFNGRALVTVERDTVLRSFLAELSGNAPAIRVPLEAVDAPNVWVSVLLVRGAADSPKKSRLPEHRLGYCQLRVENPKMKLEVAVATDAPDYRPGQPVQATAEVKDSGGQPVPDAEITLYAVDEGILSLTGYETPDPHAFFYRPRPLKVLCGLSLPGLLPEDPEKLVFANKGYLIGGGGRERLRKDFLPCAFWAAALVTDAAGRVTVRFTAPDSLTRYRVIAVAHTLRSQFGSAQSHFEINKPVMIEPALPRFANITDRILARAVVHNRTAQAGEVDVTLRLDEKAVPGSGTTNTLTKRVAVKAHSSATVDFPLTFTEPGEAKWIWTATTAGFANGGSPFTDSVQSTLNIGHAAPLLREIYLARTEALETNLLAGANPQLLEGRGAVTVDISNTRLSELGEAISHLLHYPYGCIEQTGSSLLPWIALRNAASVGPQLNKPAAEVDSAIRAGIRRLFSMQLSGGGLTYWPGSSEPTFWGSAYGGVILALARREGLPLPSESFARLCGYLSEQLRGSAEANDNLSARCLALYALALAGRAEPAYHEVLFKKREKLSLENRALLALAILESSGPPALVEELLSRPRSAPPSDDYFGGDARALAVQLLAWSRFRPTDRNVDILAAELMRLRWRAHWGTTQGNAWAIHALTDYARRVEGALNPAQGTLTWAGRTNGYQLLAQPSRVESILPLSDSNRAAPLVLANPDRRRLYTQVKVEARSQVAQQPRQDRGYTVGRRYARLDDDGTPRELRDLRVGDRVLITLDLQVQQAAHYVAVDDPLPSLFEAVNPEFKSQETGPVAALATEGFDWFSDFRELRTDRALFFRDHLEPGRYTLRYLARVRAAGTATAPATKVEEMYHPERFGLSEAVQVTALPLN
jgi:alpha-2-macroglobulin